MIILQAGTTLKKLLTSILQFLTGKIYQYPAIIVNIDNFIVLLLQNA